MFIISVVALKHAQRTQLLDNHWNSLWIKDCLCYSMLCL